MSEPRTLFKRVDYDLAGLLNYIDLGDIGLPDIQRPFVWSNAKVRDLFDSMYRGFPVGYLLFWENANVNGAKVIGVGEKAHTTPRLLIVDGQQRLTSLFAVFRGKPVLNEEYEEVRIEIAFRPRDSKFEVADAAIKKDPEFIPNVSMLWKSGSSSRKLINDYINHLSAKQLVSESEEEAISINLDRLFDLQKYPFTALEIAPTVEEEQVADIFVRINSEGVKLNQADFILTLLSVFGEDIRSAFEHFSREARKAPVGAVHASPFNHFIDPSPDQLLRVSVALGFFRGRLKSVYQILRGKDLATGEFSPDRRDVQFERLRAGQREVLNLTYWHQFLNALVGAGFRSGEMVSSENALLYSYSLYLIGRTRFAMPSHQLDKLIGRWFFAVTVDGRYTSSPETVMDADLNLVKDLRDASAFTETLTRVIRDTLTSDFWSITLPNELETSSARSPALFAYYAAQNLQKAPVLFSNKRICDLLDPAIRSKKKALERHHLFPKAWLESMGITDVQRVNQTANYALLEWPDNIDISDNSPAAYLPRLKARFDAATWKEMSDLHGLPDGWESLGYDEFLACRRALMAGVIKRGFDLLS